MNEFDQNINKDMIDSDLIDLESLDFSNDQTWLYKVPGDSGQNVDIIDWNLSFDWPNYSDDEYLKEEAELSSLFDNINKNETTDEKQKFDSRTYVRPKKRTPRPSLQSMTNQNVNNYLTYNKYSTPIGGVSPMLRLKTFNVDCGDRTGVKEYTKRRSLVQDEFDDSQVTNLDDLDMTLVSLTSDRLSSEHAAPTKPIKIDYSQPAHNTHAFNKGISTLLLEHPSFNMYQSGESLMRMSPPSLVSSLMMDSSGNFNSLDRNSITEVKIENPPSAVRDSIDPMLTSMTLSILDEKDMSTSFLSQTTHPDNECLIDSLPPSLVNSVNSSFIASTNSMHMEQEKLLNRPKYQPFKRELRNTDSYIKSNDTFSVLNENSAKPSNLLTDTITLHYSNKFRSKDDEKENLNSSFEKSDAFYLDNSLQKCDIGKGSLNVTLDKHELNEIKQARQKLSLARKNLPLDSEKADLEIKMPDQTVITVPRQVMSNATDILSKRRTEREDNLRETPKRNSTFKKVSPKSNSASYTVVCEKMIDINSATMNLIDPADNQEKWNPESRAMVGSNESTDTATYSSSSPPDFIPDNTTQVIPGVGAESTPLRLYKRDARPSLNQITKTISPIYTSADNNKTYEHNQTVINTGTIVKRTANGRRDAMAKKDSPEKKSPPNAVRSPVKSPTYSASQVTMAPPATVPKRSGLPSSKLRQYSSHKELSRIPPSNPVVKSSLPSRGVLRTPVYSSNPALSPTQQAPVIRRESYVLSTDDHSDNKEKSPPRPQLIRQGTETLRRPSARTNKDLRAAPTVTMLSNARAYSMPVSSRPYSIAGTSGLRSFVRPAGQLQKTSTAASSTVLDNRASEARASALPRPSRLPAPRRTQRPPSAYTVAPSGELDHY